MSGSSKLICFIPKAIRPVWGILPLKKSVFPGPQAPNSTSHSLESRSALNGRLGDFDFSKIPHPRLPRGWCERCHSRAVNLQPAPSTKLHSENIVRSTLLQTLAPKDRLEETLVQLTPFWALWSEMSENVGRVWLIQVVSTTFQANLSSGLLEAPCRQCWPLCQNSC